jgi:transcriptional regulator with XRE-family HTH domain
MLLRAKPFSCKYCGMPPRTLHRADTRLAILMMRTDAGLTQQQLGAKAGVRGPSICQYELAKKTPSWENLEKLRRACGKTPEELEALLDLFAEIRSGALRPGTPELTARRTERFVHAAGQLAEDAARTFASLFAAAN